MGTPTEELRPEITAILGNLKPCSAHALLESLKLLSSATFIPDPLSAPAQKRHVAQELNRLASSKLPITESDLLVLLEFIGLPAKFQDQQWNFEPEQDSLLDFGNIQERIEQMEVYFE